MTEGQSFQDEEAHTKSADTNSMPDEEEVPDEPRRLKEDSEQSPDPEKQHDIARRQQGPPPPPNGGYGWVCTACIATINGHTWGLNSSYGVFLAYYLRNDVFPGATPLDFAFVGGLSIGTAMIISPVATLTVSHLGTKPALFIGLVFEAGSLIAASFAHQLWQLLLSQGVCFGLGMGLLFVSSVGIVPQWFTTRRSLANGIAAAGSGIGGLVYSLATGAMLKSIGLAWTFRTLGVLAFVVNFICTLLIKDRNKAIGSTVNAFEVKLFARLEYLLLCGFGFFSMLGYVVLIFSLANYANAIKLSASQASIVSALLNLGQGLGRPPIGYFSDTIGRINMAGMMTFACAVFTFAIWIPAKSYGVLILFALLGGTVAGTFWATAAPVAAEITGLKLVPSALNLLWLVITLPTTFSEPIALEIVAGTGSYIGTQLFVGSMYIAAATCLLFLRGWKIGEVDEIARIKGQAAEEVEVVAFEYQAENAHIARAAGRKRIFTDCWKWRKV